MRGIKGPKGYGNTPGMMNQNEKTPWITQENEDLMQPFNKEEGQHAKQQAENPPLGGIDSLKRKPHKQDVLTIEGSKQPTDPQRRSTSHRPGGRTSPPHLEITIYQHNKSK